MSAGQPHQVRAGAIAGCLSFPACTSVNVRQARGDWQMAHITDDNSPVFDLDSIS